MEDCGINSVREYPEAKIIFVGDKHLNHSCTKIIDIFKYYSNKYNKCEVKIILEHSYRSSNMRIMYNFAKDNRYNVEIFDPRIELIDEKIKYAGDYIRIRYIIYNNIYKMRRDLCFHILDKLKSFYNVGGVTVSLIREFKSTDEFLNGTELVKLREILADYMDYELMKKINTKGENEMIFIVAGTYHAKSFKKNKQG